jgi:hypothetical protein
MKIGSHETTASFLAELDQAIQNGFFHTAIELIEQWCSLTKGNYLFSMGERTPEGLPNMRKITDYLASGALSQAINAKLNCGYSISFQDLSSCNFILIKPDQGRTVYCVGYGNQQAKHYQPTTDLKQLFA